MSQHRQHEIRNIDSNAIVGNNSVALRNRNAYTRSQLEDSRLFGPGPWKVLAATNEQKYPSNPAPGENIVSGNLVLETGCTCRTVAPSRASQALWTRW